MKIKHIECLDKRNELVGVFCSSDFVEKTWICKFANYEKLKTLYKFKEFSIQIVV